MTAPKKTARRSYFISDAHLGSRLRYPAHREQILIDFLTDIRKDADQLFILGDLFDFWIEYRHAIRPDYFNILCTLKTLVQQGVTIHYIAGNHDFAMGSFLTDQVGVNVHLDSWEIITDTHRIYLTHGDGLIAADKGYRLLKRFLRNPILQHGYRLVHPDLGVGLATFFSRLSRGREKHKGPKFGPEHYRHAAWALSEGGAENGFDMVLMGHTHRPEIIHHQGKIYCNTGDWIQSFTYACLDASTLSLWRYRPGQPPIEITPEKI